MLNSVTCRMLAGNISKTRGNLRLKNGGHIKNVLSALLTYIRCLFVTFRNKRRYTYFSYPYTDHEEPKCATGGHDGDCGGTWCLSYVSCVINTSYNMNY